MAHRLDLNFASFSLSDSKREFPLDLSLSVPHQLDLNWTKFALGFLVVSIVSKTGETNWLSERFSLSLRLFNLHSHPSTKTSHSSISLLVGLSVCLFNYVFLAMFVYQSLRLDARTTRLYLCPLGLLWGQPTE